MGVARATERNRVDVAGAEAPPPSAPDVLSAGGEATISAADDAACGVREGGAFTCGAIIAKEYELEQVRLL